METREYPPNKKAKILSYEQNVQEEYEIAFKFFTKCTLNMQEIEYHMQDIDDLYCNMEIDKDDDELLPDLVHS